MDTTEIEAQIDALQPQEAALREEMEGICKEPLVVSGRSREDSARESQRKHQTVHQILDV